MRISSALLHTPSTAENIRRAVSPPAAAARGWRWPARPCSARRRASQRPAADAAADPARRSRAGRGSRQPHVHADFRPAGPGPRSAAAVRSRNVAQHRPRPGDRRLVHRRPEKRHRAPGARPRSCCRWASTTASTAPSSGSAGASPRHGCSTSTTWPARVRTSAARGAAAARPRCRRHRLVRDMARGVKVLLSPYATFTSIASRARAGHRLSRTAGSRRAVPRSVHDRVHRQVQIDAQVLEVELSDADAERSTGPPSPREPGRRHRTRWPAGGGRSLIARLARRAGPVTTVAAPRVLALNNEPALVRASAEAPTSRRVSAGARRRHARGDPADLADQRRHAEPQPDRHAAGCRQRQRALTATRETDSPRASPTARRSCSPDSPASANARTADRRHQRRLVRPLDVVTRKRIELVIMLTPRILPPVGAP